MTNVIYSDVRQDVLDYIIHSVQYGIKGIELISLATKYVCTEYPEFIDIIDVVKLISLLVAQKEIVEVEYVLPHMDYRSKSIYFPKGTKINKFVN